MATKFTSKWMKNPPEAPGNEGAISDKSSPDISGSPADGSLDVDSTQPLLDRGKRVALLDRLRSGHVWLLDQHQRWQLGDSTAVGDAEFSKAWNGWWELDQTLRSDLEFQGCIYGPEGACPEGFPCQGCGDEPAPGVVAQLVLAASNPPEE